MFCQKCGNQVVESAAFCQKCGTNLHKEGVNTTTAETTSTTNEETKFNVSETARYDVILTQLTDFATMEEVIVATEIETGSKYEDKDFVDNLPITLQKDVTKTAGEFIQDIFSEIGAVVILKCCPDCGNPLTNDSKRCGTCGKTAITLPNVFGEEKTGTKISSATPQQQNAVIETATIVHSTQNFGDFGGVHCPKCKSNKLQSVVESDTKSKGGGYSIVKGFLYALVFGLIGFLLGGIFLFVGLGIGLLCGFSKVKITTTNKTFFMCIACGNKFREAKELMEEKSKEIKNSFIAGAVCVVLTIIFLIDKNTGIGMVLMFAFFAFACIGNSYIEKKEVEEIEATGYKAACYKKDKKK